MFSPTLHTRHRSPALIGGQISDLVLATLPQLAHVHTRYLASHLQSRGAAQFGFLHQAKLAAIVISGKPVRRKYVASEVEEPLAAAMALGPLAIIANHTQFAV